MSKTLMFIWRETEVNVWPPGRLNNGVQYKNRPAAVYDGGVLLVLRLSNSQYYYELHRVSQC